MKRNIRTFLAALLLLFPMLGWAVTFGGPSTGLWYNASESGRGFNIDLQGNTMIVTTFIYTNTGAPIWYLSSGTYNHDTATFHSSYDSYSDGQCFGCPPTRPIVHGNAAGPITIIFHTNQSATLSYAGGSTNIVKFNYGFGTAVDNLYGEWALTFNIAGLIGGDWVVLGNEFIGSDGTVYAAGNMDGAPEYPALGTYSSALNAYVILVSIGNFNDFYQIALDDRRGFGAAWILSGDEEPSGSGSPAAAGRILWEDEITHLNAATKARIVDDRSRYVQSPTGPTDPAFSEVARRLRAAMAEKRLAEVL